MSERTKTQIHRFMRRQLKRKLSRDLRDLRILKEADVECCIYFHLRKFLGNNSKWRVFAHKYTPMMRVYPDLVVCEGRKARFIAEIKWWRGEISQHDRRKLRRLRARKKYFIMALPDADEYSKATKKPIEKYKLFEIVADLGFRRDKTKRMEAWKKERGELRKI